MTSTVIISVAILTVLGVAIAVVLYLIAQKFKVVEDPRIDEVEAALPAANCGGCGFAGCRGFAVAAVAADDLSELSCPPGGNSAMSEIAKILGKTVVEAAPKVAVVRCNGTPENCPHTNRYDGAASCAIAVSLYTGNTDCSYGCIGKGDCVPSCKFDAMYMDKATGLPVVLEDKCTGCGACIKACPKAIIELRKKGPKGKRIFVSCVNKDKGGIAKKACAVACTGCTKCKKVCEYEAVTIENNLAYIDWEKCKLCRKCTTECATGAIWEVAFPARKEKTEN